MTTPPITNTEYLIKKYDRPVPRYTSYPTAVQFTPETGVEEHEEWLASVLPERPVSLYIHIPFCRVLCLYCGCHTKALGDNYNPVARYVEALKNEITRVAAKIGRPNGRKQKVSHIHLGGGTPTFLKLSEMELLFSGIHDAFTVLPDAEIAIEIDPRLMTREQTKDLVGLGINRISFGVQDFDEIVQRAIGRVQPYEVVAKVYKWFRKAGVNAINFDMMYGLPLQTEEALRDNALKVVELRPDRIALFGYAHVPWMKKNQKVLEQYNMPGAIERYNQFAAAKGIWLEHGYKAVGIDHFALPEDTLYTALENKTLHRNFMGYTTDRADTILAFGASSISAFPQGYIQNIADTKIWQDTLEENKNVACRGLVLSAQDMLNQRVIEDIMCHGKVDLSILRQPGKQPVILDEFEKDGLISIENSILTVTTKGQPFTRVICTAFDEYLEEKPERHARAV